MAEFWTPRRSTSASFSTAFDLRIKRGSKPSITCTSILAVSTGLTSPVYAIITMRGSTTGGCPLQSFTPYFRRGSGSYIILKFATGTVVRTGSRVAFNWLAFET